MKQLKFTTFVIVGFLITVLLWGFIGGCGSKHSMNYEFEDSDISSTAVRENGVPEKEIQEKETTIVYKKEEIKAGEPITTVFKQKTYTVVKGDTLWHISRRMGVSVNTIKRTNKLKGDSLSVGQVLVFPGNKKSVSKKIVKKIIKNTNSNLIIYKINKGDSLWRIAQKSGTTIEKIIALNGLTENDKLVPGQELLVPRYEAKR